MSLSRFSKTVARPVISAADRRLGTLQGVQTAERVFALTFDDGPHPKNTPTILEVLRSRGARATFFVLVNNVTKFASLAREVLDDGHEIALHGWAHNDLTNSTTRELIRSTWTARHKLEELTGRRVSYFRPPYGAQHLIAYIAARASGLEVVGWSSSPRDFLALDVDRQVALALDELEPGGIMLLHDGGPTAPSFRKQVLDAILAGAARDGWRLPVSISQLLTAGDPARSLWFQRRPEAMSGELRPFYVQDEPP